MVTMDDLKGMYCEDYNDQNGSDFKFLSYTPFRGEPKVEAVSENLAGQTHEIYRRYGKRTAILLYR